MQILTKILAVLGIVVVFAMPSAADVAYADEPVCKLVVGQDGKWYNPGNNGEPSGNALADSDNGVKACKEAAGGLLGKILRFVSILSGLVIVAAVGMITYAGFKYITSQGEPKAVESAKQQLWYSGVGLFIVLTAFTILKLFMNASGY